MSRFAGQSKFFGGGDDSSSSDTDSEKEEVKAQESQQLIKKSKYMVGSDDEEDVERVIKSGVTKRAEALDKVLEDLTRHVKISDFNSIESDFTKLENEIKKCAEEMFEEKGAKLPPKVLKVFLLIEDSINDVNAEQKKKMSKINSTSYNKLKQRFKKYLSAEGEDEMNYEKQLIKWRANPVEEKKVERKEVVEVKKEQTKSKAPVKQDVKQEEEEDSESDEEILA